MTDTKRFKLFHMQCRLIVISISIEGHTPGNKHQLNAIKKKKEINEIPIIKWHSKFLTDY